jgi:hypothetical protein
VDIARAASNFHFFATAILHFHSDAYRTDRLAQNYTLHQPHRHSALPLRRLPHRPPGPELHPAPAARRRRADLGLEPAAVETLRFFTEPKTVCVKFPAKMG